jgi:DNA polymerase
VSAEEYVPIGAGIEGLRAAANHCEGCDLYRNATQTVFGAGPADGAVLIVGEQPGDREDRAGEPFVGPAGRLLDRALDEAGIDRAAVYVTNAVKHFKFRRDERGKRRIHQKPSRTEVVACRPWLLAELDVVEPDLVLCLGATAAQSLLGPDFRITRERGKVLDLPMSRARVVSTVHPSAVLRAPDRESAYQELVADLRSAASVLSGQNA